MSFEVNKFDLLYGKLLGKGLSQNLAKQLATTLYRLSSDTDIAIDLLIKEITLNGIKFDDSIYTELNRYRSNSSQIGYLNPAGIPRAISYQIPDTNS